MRVTMKAFGGGGGGMKDFMLEVSILMVPGFRPTLLLQQFRFRLPLLPQLQLQLLLVLLAKR